MDDLAPDSIEAFLARSGVKASTLKEYNNRLRRCERLLGKPLAKATLRDIGQIKTHLRRQASGAGAVRCLGMFYREVGRTDLATACRLVQRTKKIQAEDLLTPAEVGKLIGHAPSVRDKALFGCMWDLGWRVGDIVALQLKNVFRRDAADGLPLMFQVKFQASKNSLPLDNRIRESAGPFDAWLRIHPTRRPESYVFCHRDGSPLTEQRVRQLVAGTTSAAKIGKRVYPHLFRHSRATHLLQLGLSDATVKKLLGWSDGSQVFSKTYAHLVSGDAYRNLLRAQGFPVPPPGSVDQLMLADDSFTPAVPATPTGERPRTHAVPPEVAALLDEPQVQAFVTALAAMRKVPTSS